MEISAEKTKLMTNNTSGINIEIKVNRQKLETVTNFKYLGSVESDEGSLQDGIDDSSIEKVETSLDRQEVISLRSKKRLMRFLVTSIFMYACES